MSLNSRNFNPGGSPGAPGPTVHTYISGDTIAAIETNGYFDALASNLRTGDILIAVSTVAGSTGGTKLYKLTVTTGDVALSTGTAIS